jgi:DNA-binding Xre family transcriptional regulator
LYCQYKISEVDLRVKLREAMEEYRRRTGERLTHGSLAQRTGLSKATLESLASRESYNTRLSTIETLCRSLGCTPGDLLELGDGEGAHEDQ